MATSFQQPEATLSLLDRLMDLDPESQQEPLVHSWELEREFLNGLCRDLSALLNTRRAAGDFDTSYAEAVNSLLSFGVMDFTSYNLKKGPEQEQLRRSIERAIRQFEPRLAGVSVSIEEADPQRLALPIQISAVLRTGTPEPVTFSATLHRDSRRIAVSRAT
jgi:type VI secretion system protein ImpF